MIFRYPGLLVPLFLILASTSSSPSIHCLQPRLLYTAICCKHHIQGGEMSHVLSTKCAGTQAPIPASPPSMFGILPVRHSHINFQLRFNLFLPPSAILTNAASLCSQTDPPRSCCFDGGGGRLSHTAKEKFGVIFTFTRHLCFAQELWPAAREGLP